MTPNQQNKAEGESVEQAAFNYSSNYGIQIAFTEGANWQKQQSTPTSVSGVDELAGLVRVKGNRFAWSQNEREAATELMQAAYTLSNKHTVGVIEERMEQIKANPSHFHPARLDELTTLLNQVR